MIEPGKHVKCFLRNTVVLEGIVEEWSSKLVLKSLDGKSLMIVHRPSEDIFMTKVMLLEELIEISPEENVVEETETKQHIREKLHEVLQPTGDTELDKMNINQLRELARAQDRLIISQKRKEHFGTPGAVKQAVKYSSPFVRKQ